MAKQETYEFRAYARPSRHGTVIAECIDLDIIVEAPTLADAKQKLLEAVHGYLEIAFESEDPSDLLPRRSPLRNQLRYRLWTFFYAALRRFHIVAENLALFFINNSGHGANPQLAAC